MMSPIASAMRPETPVSISSKMMVGSCIRLASRALMASMTRESSPPEAIFSMGRGAALRLAVKRNSTASAPVRPGSVGVRHASNCVSGIPSRASVAQTDSAKAGAALARPLRSRSASVPTLAWAC